MNLAPLKRQRKRQKRLDSNLCSLGAIKGLFGGGGADAAKDAGRIQQQAADKGAEIAKEQYLQTRGDLAPYLNAGNPALQQYMALLGLGGGGQFGGGGRTEQQIRDQLLQSGQFNTPAQGGTDLEFFSKYGVTRPKTIEQARSQWAIGASAPGGGAINDTFVNPQDYFKQSQFKGSTGGFDQTGFDAELQRQLGSQPSGGQFNQNDAINSIYESPGQQFIRSRAQKNLLRNSAALGGIGGGNVRTALTEQGAGFAAQDLQNQFGRLQNLIGGGQNAATNLGQFGQNYATTAAGLGNQAAQARASGILGAQQAKSSGLGNILGLGASLFSGGLGGALGSAGVYGGGSATLSGAAGLADVPRFFSDERLKTNIHDLNTEQCYNAVMNMPLKAWKYLEESGLDQSQHMGVMAQDAPDCIKGDDMDGYKTLDLHDELTLIIGALQHAHKMNKAN